MASSDDVPRYCPSCGARAEPKDQFCARCGQSFTYVILGRDPAREDREHPPGSGTRRGTVRSGTPGGAFWMLDWRKIFRRAATFVLAYLAVMFFVSLIAPGSFGPRTAGQWVPILVNAFVFFAVFSFVHVLIDYRRLRGSATGPSRTPAYPPGRGTTVSVGAGGLIVLVVIVWLLTR